MPWSSSPDAAHNVSKYYGNIRALEGVSLEVHAGEISCVLGDNGAGKSTLIKILTGVHTPTRGEITFEDRPVQIRSPQDARDLGIETVYQDLALVDLMSITRNFFLGREMVGGLGPLRWLKLREMDGQTRRSLGEIGIEVRSPSDKVLTLSGGERQSIAIGRALHFGAKLLILDEPTSALSVAETRKVLNYTLNAKERGLSVIFITHNIHHVYLVADRYTILRHGRVAGNYRKGELTENDIADLVAGVRES